MLFCRLVSAANNARWQRFRAGIVAPEEAGPGPHDVLSADAVPLRQAIIHGHACVHLCQFLRKLSALPPK